MDAERKKWLENRQNGIGSSDSAAIWGVSPYKTAQDILKDKCSEIIDEPSNFAMNKGNELEPISREQFAARYNMEHDTDEDFMPKNVFMEDLPFMMASLDGASRDLKVIIECKYQGKENHANVAKGIVQPHYLVQVKHQLLVSGAEKAFLVSINDAATKDINYTEITLDEKWAKQHIKKCSEFWARVLEYRAGNKKAMPETTAKDWVEVEGDSPLVRLAEKYRQYKAELDILTKNMETVKEEIMKNKPDHPRVRVGALNIMLIEKKGNVIYKNIPELKNVDLEKYRGKSTTYYKIGMAGEKDAE